MALSKIDVANMLTGATPVANGGTAATTLAAAGLDKRPNAKPLIVNGSMDVAQRGTSQTTASGYTTVDRFRNFLDDGAVTATQESLTSGNAYINGFANAFKLDVTTADSSVANNHLGGIQYRFEGQDLQVFKKGTANAEKFTVAFWIKSTKTGTYICELEDQDNSRNNSQSYTVSTTNTWEHKVVNFPADTTGVFGDDNAHSLNINWFIMAGTDYTSGTLQEAWGSETSANRCVGQVNALDNTSNNIHITGVQLEVGEFSSTTLPPFQHESYGDNLARCHRYFEHRGNTVNSEVIFHAHCIVNNKCLASLHFIEKRAVPSLTLGTAIALNQSNGVAGDVSSKSIQNGGVNTARYDITIDATGFSVGDITGIQVNNTDKEGLEIDAEL